MEEGSPWRFSPLLSIELHSGPKLTGKNRTNPRQYRTNIRYSLGIPSLLGPKWSLKTFPKIPGTERKDTKNSRETQSPDTNLYKRLFTPFRIFSISTFYCSKQWTTYLSIRRYGRHHSINGVDGSGGRESKIRRRSWMLQKKNMYMYIRLHFGSKKKRLNFPINSEKLLVFYWSFCYRSEALIIVH